MSIHEIWENDKRTLIYSEYGFWGQSGSKYWTIVALVNKGGKISIVKDCNLKIRRYKILNFTSESITYKSAKTGTIFTVNRSSEDIVKSFDMNSDGHKFIYKKLEEIDANCPKNI
ncbi:MAG: hypothetical protein IMF09_00680 [Proteobacteria bacterium]|nr:hypothetical protein [Pseudomonadota bacterium]